MIFNKPAIAVHAQENESTLTYTYTYILHAALGQSHKLLRCVTIFAGNDWPSLILTVI